MHSIIYWFKHLTGTDSQTTWFYMWWSGIATQASIVFAAVAYYRHHNCHRRWCWRLGHIDPEHHHPACRKHHSHGGKVSAGSSNR